MHITGGLTWTTHVGWNPAANLSPSTFTERGSWPFQTYESWSGIMTSGITYSDIGYHTIQNVHMLKSWLAASFVHNYYYYYFHLTTIFFSGEHGSAALGSSSSIFSRKESLWINAAGFVMRWMSFLPPNHQCQSPSSLLKGTQSTNPNQWPDYISFFIYNRTPDGRGVALFTQARQHQSTLDINEIKKESNWITSISKSTKTVWSVSAVYGKSACRTSEF